MERNELSCPEFHVWFIIVSGKESLLLKCKFCAAESKAYRYPGLTPTAQLLEINGDKDARKDPYKYPIRPDSVFDEKVR